jgi:hypothetical protein
MGIISEAEQQQIEPRPSPLTKAVLQKRFILSRSQFGIDFSMHAKYLRLWNLERQKQRVMRQSIIAGRIVGWYAPFIAKVKFHLSHVQSSFLVERRQHFVHSSGGGAPSQTHSEASGPRVRLTAYPGEEVRRLLSQFLSILEHAYFRDRHHFKTCSWLGTTHRRREEEDRLRSLVLSLPRVTTGRRPPSSQATMRPCA